GGHRRYGVEPHRYTQRGGGRGRGNGVAAYVTQIDVEIFELDGPVAVERPFGTGSDGPAGASVAPAQRNRWRIGAEMAIGETARRVEQKLRRRQQAHAAARRAEPVESIICREEQRSRRAACGRAQRAGRMLVAA